MPPYAQKRRMNSVSGPGLVLRPCAGRSSVPPTAAMGSERVFPLRAVPNRLSRDGSPTEVGLAAEVGQPHRCAEQVVTPKRTDRLNR